MHASRHPVDQPIYMPLTVQSPPIPHIALIIPIYQQMAFSNCRSVGFPQRLHLLIPAFSTSQVMRSKQCHKYQAMRRIQRCHEESIEPDQIKVIKMRVTQERIIDLKHTNK